MTARVGRFLAESKIVLHARNTCMRFGSIKYRKCAVTSLRLSI